MKIIGFRAENIMRLLTVEFEPDGTTVLITGANGAGKTSALDSILLALEYRTACKKIKKPIRTGADHAEIVLDLGEFKVTRTFTAAGKTYLKVENPDGAQYRSPQELLDKFKSSLSFDPLAFTALSDKEQAVTLRELLGIDTTELDEQRAELYDHRANWNRQAKERAGALQAHAGANVPEDTPDAEISVSELLGELEEAEAQKDKNQSVRDHLESHHQAANVEINAMSKHKAEIAVATTALKVAEKALAEIEKTIPKAEKAVDALEDPPIAVIKAQIAGADAINMAVRARNDYQFVEAQRFEAENNAAKIDTKIRKIDNKKKQMVESADFPIDGLGFDETGVTFDGNPFSQASSAERLRVSLAMAMALNPKLRVIRITDGSLLDSKNLALIQEMAAAEDYQIWIEKVDETGEIGVYIEDGQIVEMAAAEGSEGR